MQNVIRALAALLLVLLAAPTASAQDLDFQFKTVVKGKDLPALIVTPARPVKALTIELTDDAGKKQKLRATGMRAGKQKRLTFKQAAGTSHYKANIEAKWGDTGEAQLFAMEFDATRVGELKILITADDVDIDETKLSFRATNPIRRAELTVLGENGKILDDVQQSYEDAPAPSGEPIELSWSPSEEKIIRMDLRVTDIAGFYTGMRIMLFTIEIPHDEVVFEFGRADVRDREAPKLEKTMGEIKEALKTHGTLLTLKLYVGGYTDTVGGKPSNRELSQRRAHAIATWFRAHGLKIPIYYKGFGEEVLAVPTPDETEEERNRRAVYILSSQTPTGEQVPGKAWHRL